ncbi:MAG: hypothetical protein IKC33_05865 [Clostridia bacterium]|nr:hypothetical protein [Clostridia bacterium]
MKKIVIIIVFLLVFLSPLFLNKKSNSIIAANANENKMLNESNTFSYDVTVENSIVPYGNEIHISFTLNNEASNQEVSVINSSFTLLDRIITVDDEIDVYVTNNHTAGEYFFEVEAEDENDLSFTQPIYIYSDGIRDCVSTSCIEEAKDIYFCNFVATQEELILLGKIDEPENYDYTAYHYTVITEYTEFVHGTSDITSSLSIVEDTVDGKINVSGRIQWKDSSNKLHPLIDNYVALKEYNLGISEIADIIYTNEFGQFTFTVDCEDWISKGAPNFFVTLEAKNNAATVSNWGYEYIYVSPICYNLSDNISVFYDIIINPSESSNRANAFEILQMMYYSREYIKVMSGCELSTIDIRYPNIKAGCACYYDPLYIVMDQRSYDSWDVGMHEYGHYVDLYFDLSFRQGGDHSFYTDLAHLYSKRKGLRLAYTEAVATYLGISAQLYFGLQPTDIPTVGNYEYDSYNSAYWNGLNYGYGESDEGSIFGLLLTLADSVSDRDYDNVALGYDVLWDILVAEKRTNVSKLIEDIVNQYPNLKNELGLLFEHFGFAPLYLSAPETLSTNNLYDMFSWSANRTHPLTSSQLDEYSLIFYAEDFEEYPNDSTKKYQIDNITTTSYTLTINDLDSILSLSGDIVYWQVLGYNTRSADTGPYNSSLKEISKITGELELDEGLDGSVGELESVWYKFTVPAFSKYAFFTTGNCDTYGELFPAMVPDNTFTNKYSGDDDSGDGYNFRIVYNLTPGQVVYLRVSRLSDSETDDFTLCVQHVHEYVYRSVNARFHILKCHCGATSGSNEAHVINGSYSPPDGNTRYKPCIGCGEMIDTWAGGNFPIIKNNVIAYVTYQNRLIGDELLDLTITETNMSAMAINGAKYSANGSYMLPDGTAILVEEDVDAYFAGTLVFYDQDEIPLKE